jgi:hypothetical protein
MEMTKFETGTKKVVIIASILITFWYATKIDLSDEDGYPKPPANNMYMDMEKFFEMLAKKTGMSIDAIKSMYEQTSVKDTKTYDKDVNVGKDIADNIKKPVNEKVVVEVSENKSSGGMKVDSKEISEKLSQAGFSDNDITKIVNIN